MMNKAEKPIKENIQYQDIELQWIFELNKRNYSLDKIREFLFTEYGKIVTEESILKQLRKGLKIIPFNSHLLFPDEKTKIIELIRKEYYYNDRKRIKIIKNKIEKRFKVNISKQEIYKIHQDHVLNVAKNNLPYTKNDLLNLLKRHSAQNKEDCGCFSCDSVKRLLEFVCYQNGLPERLVKCSKQLHDKLAGNSCLIGNRLSISATIMYIASVKTVTKGMIIESVNLQLSQQNIALLFYITPATLRNNFNKIYTEIKQNKELYEWLMNYE